MQWQMRTVLVGLLWGATLAALAGDAVEPVATVNAFRRALESGDARTAEGVLAPELLVYESGDQDRSRSDYVRHHMEADMAFLAKAKVRVLEQQGSSQGDLAWVTTRSRIASGSGNTLGAETMILRRGGDGWRIVHIHWSSSPASKEDD